MTSRRIKALMRHLPDHKCGLRWATRENLGEVAHEKRIHGLFKAWDNKERRLRGEIMPEPKKKHKRVRVHLAEALEARQVQEIARKNAKAAMDTLEEIMKNTSKTERASDRIAAANVMLDRAYGKANSTHTNVNVDANGKLSEVSRKELTTRVEETLKTIEGLTSGTAKARPRKDRPADVRERDGDPGGSTLH